MSQPSYPFFTRYGSAQFGAWFSDTVKLHVSKPESWYPEARIEWTKRRYIGEVPRLVSDNPLDTVDVLITRDEFMAAYRLADEFLAAAETEFLPLVPIKFATSQQAKEIVRLADHPLLNRREKTKALLAIPKLTESDAGGYIEQLGLLIGLRENQPFAVSGEAYTVKAA